MFFACLAGYCLGFATGGPFWSVRVNMDKRVDHVFATVNELLFHIFGNVVGGQQGHVGRDDNMQVYMQVVAHVPCAETVDADDFGEGKSDIF